jgi:membrane associated rhomboid family serine protease
MVDEPVANAQPLDDHGHEPVEAPPESWNPLRTPVAYTILLLQIGVVVWGGWNQQRIGGDFFNFGGWLYEHGWTLDPSRIRSQPWSLLKCLFSETLPLQVLVNLSIWWSAGPALEKILKGSRLLFLYALSGLGCFLFCDLMHHAFPDTFTVIGGRSAARHAVIAVISVPVGLELVFKGPLGLLKSTYLWRRLASIGLIFLLAYGLAYGRAPIGFDVAGMLIDLIGGAIFGAALGLTLMPGFLKVLGFLACAFLTLGFAVECGFEGFIAARSDPAGFQGSSEDPRTQGVSRGGSEHRMPEEAATPKPTVIEADEPPVARERKRAAELITPYGELPLPSSEPEDQRPARKLAQELKDFTDRWTKATSANLDLEMAELSLIAGDLDRAETTADEAIKMLEDVNLAGAHDTPQGKRLARLHGVLGICYWKKGDDIPAREQFRAAGRWDRELLDVHYFLGKLAADPEEKKKEWKLFVDLVGPNPPEWQRDRRVEAKQFLGD